MRTIVWHSIQTQIMRHLSDRTSPLLSVCPSMAYKGTKLRDEEGQDYTWRPYCVPIYFPVISQSLYFAWREQQNEEPKPVFLIIEEINRGNCAFRFSKWHLLQLLGPGMKPDSLDYPIVADDDLAQELKRVLQDFKILMLRTEPCFTKLRQGCCCTSEVRVTPLLLP